MVKLDNELSIPPVALGTWSWGSGNNGGDQIFGNHLNKDDLKSVFDAGMKCGLNLWDTAAVYAMGDSETILGDYLQNIDRKDVILSTKFTPRIAQDVEHPMETMLDGSLKRLHTDYTDIYWIHNSADVKKWTPQLIPLVKSGKIKHIGLSNHDLNDLKLAASILADAGLKISAVQNHYSLLYRASEQAGIIDYCKQNNIVFFSYMVLEQGALSGKYDTNHPLPEGSRRAKEYNPLLPKLEKLIKAMREIGKDKGLSVAQVATAWAISKGTVPILGVTKPSHVEDALAASKVSLTEEECLLMEKLAYETSIDTRGVWEKPMI
ncbi:aldo/keto reductase [Companilactobacillus jidongensis]|uniref:aldo/keto reductase n=1 Tax=Companilactobacillus jidongensis TaxID=2486006 RepID=UPI000F76F3E5|nr:aldo/keto reductase [Companilactobacillus jidongensis]